MNGDAATLAVIKALNDLEIPYMLTGCMAANLYAIPRSTEDADFVVELSQAKGINEIAAKLGSDFVLDRQVSFETITASQRFLFRLKQSNFKVELFLLTNQPFDQERFARRRKFDMPDGWLWAPTVEDIIVNKLNWAKTGRRRKDLADLETLLKTRNLPIDWAYVDAWVDKLGTRTLLEEIRQSIPPE